MLNNISNKCYDLDNKALGKLKIIPLGSNSDDYQVFKEVVCDIDIMKTSSLFNGKISDDENELRYYFNVFTKINKEYGEGLYKVFDNNDNFIGLSGFILLEKSLKTLEIAYLLKKDFHHKKVAPDSICFILKLLLSKIDNIEKIIGTSFVDNIPSQIIMLKMGFKYLGKGIKRGAKINYYQLIPLDFVCNNLCTEKTREIYIEYIKKINQVPQSLIDINDYVV